MLVTTRIQSLGIPKNLRARASCVCSVEGKAHVKSEYAMKISLSCVCGSSMHKLRYVMALEHERLARKPSCSGLATLCAST
jgi:hypothetical protein